MSNQYSLNVQIATKGTLIKPALGTTWKGEMSVRDFSNVGFVISNFAMRETWKYITLFIALLPSHVRIVGNNLKIYST